MIKRYGCAYVWVTHTLSLLVIRCLRFWRTNGMLAFCNQDERKVKRALPVLILAGKRLLNLCTSEFSSVQVLCLLLIKYKLMKLCVEIETSMLNCRLVDG